MFVILCTKSQIWAGYGLLASVRWADLSDHAGDVSCVGGQDDCVWLLGKVGEGGDVLLRHAEGCGSISVLYQTKNSIITVCFFNKNKQDCKIYRGFTCIVRDSDSNLMAFDLASAFASTAFASPGEEHKHILHTAVKFTAHTVQYPPTEPKISVLYL